MPGLGIGNGIPFKNLNMFPYYYGAIRPCLENLSFLSDVIDIDNKLFKAQVGIDVPIENTNSVYLDGSAYGEIQLLGNALYTISSVIVRHSVDNVTFIESELTGDSNDPLFYFDYGNNKIVFGTNGTNFFTGWITYLGFKIDNHIAFKASLASGTADKEYNINVNDEIFWLNSASPFGVISGDGFINGNNTIIGGI